MSLRLSWLPDKHNDKVSC